MEDHEVSRYYFCFFAPFYEGSTNNIARTFAAFVDVDGTLINVIWRKFDENLCFLVEVLCIGIVFFRREN